MTPRYTIRYETAGNVTVWRNGEQIGYSEDWKLYINGRYVGEASDMREIHQLIEQELGR